MNKLPVLFNANLIYFYLLTFIITLAASQIASIIYNRLQIIINNAVAKAF